MRVARAAVLPIVVAGLVLAADLLLGAAFARAVHTGDGLLSPSGVPHVGTFALGAAALIARVLDRVLLPALVVYALVRAIGRRVLVA